MLPPAVQRKAQRAADLMKERNQPAAPEGGTPPATDAELAAAKTEVTRLEKLVQANRVEEGRLRAAADEIKELKEKLKAKEDERAAVIEAGTVTSLSEDETRLLGDLQAPVMKMAREIVRQETATLLKPIDDRTKQLERMGAAAYNATLDELVPGWEEQNDDRAFLAWLQQIDPATQTLRDDILQRANAARQGYRVAEVFLAFKEKREIQLPGAAQPAPRNIDHGPGSGTPVRVDEQVENVVTRAYIAQFYRDRSRDRLRGMSKAKELEYAKIEAKITEAIEGGLVTA